MSKKKPKAHKPLTASKRTPSSRASTTSTGNHSKWIRIERPLQLPPHVKSALQRLDDAGHVAYIVGGSVRDALLGRPTKDHDIATSASPDELWALFPNAVTVGKAFGVLKVPYPDEPGSPLLEIATFREDLEYEDHRHPTAVRFGSPVEDAQRRDFTINALFFDPKTVRILDSVEGMNDLRAKVIRAIGDPQERFREDSLRLLRAVRFATTLGFTIEPDTAAAIKARAKLVTKVSSERIRDELTLMWTGPRPDESLRMLSEMNLLRHILPEIEALKSQMKSQNGSGQKADHWQHALRVLGHLSRQSPKRSMELSWAAVLHEAGKPVIATQGGLKGHSKGDGKNFSGHEIEGARVAGVVGARFKLSRAQIERITALVENHTRFKDVFQMREATLQRFIRQEHFDEMLALHRAEAIASDGNLAYHEFCEGLYRALLAAPSQEVPKLLDGKDLIQLGFSPGPEFSAILRSVDDLALERKLTSKEEALEYVVKHFVK